MSPDKHSLHGTFSREYKPVLTINPGDTVSYSMLESRWNLKPLKHGVSQSVFEPRDLEKDLGHALVGPIFIRGAEPGMTLGVTIDHIRPGTWGWTGAGGEQTRVNERMGVAELQRVILEWELDPDTLIGRNQFGHEVALKPFLGQLGMPPDLPGHHSTRPPRFCGGNLDLKELVQGSTLYLPIPVTGGLFSAGDGHALQADGEVAGVAIECPMERVDLTFSLHDDMPLTMPRANTPSGWITLGLHEDLHEAMMIALEGMLDLIRDQHGIDRPTALALASLLVDFRVTQVVNAGVLGVHAVLPHGAIK